MHPRKCERRRGRRLTLIASLAALLTVGVALAAEPVLIDVGPVRVKPQKRLATLTVTTSGSLAKPAECSLDAGPPVPCAPRMTYRRLQRGRHTFRVEATPADGSPISAVSKVFYVARKK